MPTVREAVAAGTPVAGLALVEAFWARMCAGTREDGSTIAPNDPYWDSLQEAALAARAAPLVWLGQAQYYGALAENAAFADAFSAALTAIWDKGCVAVLEDYLAN